MDRLIGLVGLANWQGINHSWLKQAVDVCLDHAMSMTYTDAHTILNAFCLIESVATKRDIEPLYQKLTNELLNAQYFSLNVPVTTYSLTPLTFASAPESYCRPIFAQQHIDAHLDDLLSLQMQDGGWPIQWTPPSRMARCEWRAHKTVNALITLRAYSKI